jgi:hypothetical protein
MPELHYRNAIRWRSVMAVIVVAMVAYFYRKWLSARREAAEAPARRSTAGGRHPAHSLIRRVRP